MNRLLIVSLALIDLCPATAGTIVVPNAYTNTESPSFVNGPFSDAAITFQFQLSGSQFASVPIGSSLSAIGFRLDSTNTSSEPMAATTYSSYEITLSSAANSLGALSNTFASNEAPNATVVYDSALVLTPDILPGGNSINPFYLISFSTPYTYTGGDLVITFTYANPTSADLASYTVDGLSSSDGEALLNNSFNAAKGATGYNYPVTEFVVSPAPEPSTFCLAGLSGIACWSLRRRSRRSAAQEPDKWKS